MPPTACSAVNRVASDNRPLPHARLSARDRGQPYGGGSIRWESPSGISDADVRVSRPSAKGPSMPPLGKRLDRSPNPGALGARVLRGTFAAAGQGHRQAKAVTTPPLNVGPILTRHVGVKRRKLKNPRFFQRSPVEAFSQPT